MTIRSYVASLPTFTHSYDDQRYHHLGSPEEEPGLLIDISDDVIVASPETDLLEVNIHVYRYACLMQIFALQEFAGQRIDDTLSSRNRELEDWKKYAQALQKDSARPVRGFSDGMELASGACNTLSTVSQAEIDCPESLPTLTESTGSTNRALRWTISELQTLRKAAFGEERCEIEIETNNRIMTGPGEELEKLRGGNVHVQQQLEAKNKLAPPDLNANCAEVLRDLLEGKYTASQQRLKKTGGVVREEESGAGNEIIRLQKEVTIARSNLASVTALNFQLRRQNMEVSDKLREYMDQAEKDEVEELKEHQFGPLVDEMPQKLLKENLNLRDQLQAIKVAIDTGIGSAAKAKKCSNCNHLFGGKLAHQQYLKIGISCRKCQKLHWWSK